MLIKSIILVSVVCFVSCDEFSDFAKFDDASINEMQGKLIKATIAKLLVLKDEKFGSLKIMKMISDNIGAMDSEMMTWARKLRDEQKLPVLYDIFNKIHWAVYEYGFHKAMLAIPLIGNKTDQPLATGKFAATSAVIRWRCELDTKRRAVQPTVCGDETKGIADWKVQTDKVVKTLDDLIPKLHALGSEYWAKRHEEMRKFIVDNLPALNKMVSDVKDQAQRAKMWCILVEQLTLLNTVASSRPPE